MVEVELGSLPETRGRLALPDLHALVLEQLLEVLDVRHQGIVLALELREVAAPLCAAGHAVRDIAVQVLLRAVRTAIRERIAADFANLGTPPTKISFSDS